MRKFIAALSLLFVLCATLTLGVACKTDNSSINASESESKQTESIHKHSFTIESVEKKYLKTEATCTDKAKYYYSCECGERGTEIFEYGPLASIGLEYKLNEDQTTCTVINIGTCEDKNILIPVVSPSGYKVTAIDDSAFYDCFAITSITIPDSVTYIGKRAFRGCGGLTNINIHDSVTSIGEEAFDNCDNLEFNVFDNAYYLGNSDNKYLVLIKPKNNDITYCNIHPYTKMIADGAFLNCKSLVGIILGKNLRSIGESAFYTCSSIYITDLSAWCNISGLENLMKSKYGRRGLYLNTESTAKLIVDLVIPKDITTIGEYTFFGCSEIKNVTIPKGVTGIGSYAFASCRNLIDVTISDGVIDIGSYAFADCSHLIDITIPDSVINIGKSAFENCDILNYSEYDNAYYLGPNANPYAFLIKVRSGTVNSCEVHQDTKNICSGAFINSSIRTVTIGEKVTTIAESAFYGCQHLTSIIISNSVTSIGSDAFVGCDRLQNIYITDLTSWCNISGLSNLMVDYYGSETNRNLYLNEQPITNLVIPEEVTHIADYAFYGCKELTSVVIPNNITYIGKSAFGNCDSLNYNVYDNALYLGNSRNPYLALVKAKDTLISACNINPQTKIILDSAINIERDFRKTQQKTPNNIGNSLQMIA